MSQPSFDVIVFGATSFVGQILSQYLCDQFAPGELNWAMAGRSESKLQEVKALVGDKAKDIPVFVADAADHAALKNLCEQTKVIISTVGPYALYGEPMIKACCDTGTDYCDLTGEAHWIKRMVDRYEDQAKASGARIVHSCGFDSIPSDLGVYFLQQQAQQQFGTHCNDIKMRVKKLKGGASGGTIASVVNLTKEASKDPALRKELANPYSICPPGHKSTVRQKNIIVEYDEEHSSWVGPFIMAGINTRIVHRSNGLSGNAYGEDFLYEEATLVGDGEKAKRGAKKAAFGMKAFTIGAALAPTRWVLEKFILPKPGEGPTPEQQLKGGFDLRFAGTTSDGKSIKVKVTGDRDPGYGSTAKMLGQSAACLAFDIDDSRPGGFWTPATLLGEPLIERLISHAGLKFDIVE
jgi:short subunit dehydrogenase-like uncharacterized protein